jgi:hypothetical protein
MAVVTIRYRASIETFKTDTPHEDVNERMSKYTEDILSIMVDGEIIYTKQ